MEAHNEENTGWADNYFCWRKDKLSPGFSFHNSDADLDLNNNKCTKIVEPEDYEDSWDDNYLCVPNDLPLNFEFYHDGKPSGKECIEWREPCDSNGWNDGSNWLCA